MAQEIRNLIVDEVSLVEASANALTDPITGRKTPLATVALFKRDDSKEKTMSLKKILKSANLSRDSIAQAVKRKAAKIAKRKGNCRETATSAET